MPLWWAEHDKFRLTVLPRPLATMGITSPWLTCLQSSAVPSLLLVPCPRSCIASSGTRLHLCFLGTSLLHTHRETSTCQGLLRKMANKEGKMLACLFFSFFFSSVSLWIPFCRRVFLCKKLSVAKKSSCQLLLAAAVLSDWIHQRLPLPGSPGPAASTQWEGHEDNWASVPGAQSPQESTAHKPSNPFPCGFSFFPPPSPQTQGRVINETNYHVCHRDRRPDSSVSLEMQISNCSILLWGKRN